MATSSFTGASYNFPRLDQDKPVPRQGFSIKFCRGASIPAGPVFRDGPGQPGRGFCPAAYSRGGLVNLQTLRQLADPLELPGSSGPGLPRYRPKRIIPPSVRKFAPGRLLYGYRPDQFAKNPARTLYFWLRRRFNHNGHAPLGLAAGRHYLCHYWHEPFCPHHQPLYQA